MSARLLETLGTTDALAEVFSDRSVVTAMLRFEVALARAEAVVGLIPASAAAAIEQAAEADGFDAAEIARDARASGTLTIPLVHRLAERVSAISADATAFLHRGATSQDVSDSALVLCLVEASRVMRADHERLLAGLKRQSDAHAGTVMLARTLLQPAGPTTFGLKAAGWFGAVARTGVRLFDAFEEARVLQFGGGAGTLAALGADGLKVSRALARELDLSEPDAPWHAHRDRMAALIAACGVCAGTLGKLARDISLLMQFEVGEAAEPGGLSSTLPHKHNPAGCAIALAAAARVPGLVGTYLSTMSQEHERGLGNWHAEAATIAAAVQATGAAMAAMAGAIEELQVDAARMRGNIAATRGVIFAEAALMRLAPAMGKARALAAISAALAAVRGGGVNFVEALTADDEVRRALGADGAAGLESPEAYLGAAEEFRRRLLNGAE